MNVMIYQQGRPGVLVALPGDEPLAEIGELLDCTEVEVTKLDGGLSLVEAADAERRQLPIRYAVERLGRASYPVAGDCVVAAMKSGGEIRSATEADVAAAGKYIREVTYHG